MAETQSIKKVKKVPAKKAEKAVKNAPKIEGEKVVAIHPNNSAKTTKKEIVKDGSFAVIETGGKQYKVSVGDSIKIEKIIGELKEGDKVAFDKVLLVDNGNGSTDVGTPFIQGAKVNGTISEIGRNKKVTVIKYKQKSRYFKKNGHRQPFFKIEIESIS